LSSWKTMQVVTVCWRMPNCSSDMRLKPTKRMDGVDKVVVEKNTFDLLLCVTQFLMGHGTFLILMIFFRLSKWCQGMIKKIRYSPGANLQKVSPSVVFVEYPGYTGSTINCFSLSFVFQYM
jgi:hypothetical protein